MYLRIILGLFEILLMMPPYLIFNFIQIQIFVINILMSELMRSCNRSRLAFAGFYRNHLTGLFPKLRDLFSSVHPYCFISLIEVCTIKTELLLTFSNYFVDVSLEAGFRFGLPFEKKR